MSDTKDLAQLRELAEKATPGPWVASTNNGCRDIGRRVGERKISSIVTTDGISPDSQDRANANFIAACRTALPALLDALAAAEKREKELEAGLNGMSLEQATKLFQAMQSVALGRITELSAEERNLVTNARLQAAESALAAERERVTQLETIMELLDEAMQVSFRSDNAFYWAVQILVASRKPTSEAEIAKATEIAERHGIMDLAVRALAPPERKP